ncbi:MAG: hypothetical protein MJ252_16405 [archaeon]|nr:hypothetical protein [archaeon]
MFYKTLNFIFISLLLTIPSITSLSTNASKLKLKNMDSESSMPPVLNQNSEEKEKKYETVNEDELSKLISYYADLSKKYPEQFFMIILSSVEDIFPFDIQGLKKLVNVYKYNIKTKPDQHFSQIYLIRKGSLLENQKLNYETDQTQLYIQYLLGKYPLIDMKKITKEPTKEINKKVLLSTSTSTEQNGFEENGIKEVKEPKEVPEPKQPTQGKSTKRLIRFIWAILLVLLFSLSLFFLVKYSIDWATNGKTEINKTREEKLKEVTEVIFSKDF